MDYWYLDQDERVSITNPGLCIKIVGSSELLEVFANYLGRGEMTNAELELCSQHCDLIKRMFSVGLNDVEKLRLSMIRYMLDIMEFSRLDLSESEAVWWKRSSENSMPRVMSFDLKPSTFPTLKCLFCQGLNCDYTFTLCGERDEQILGVHGKCLTTHERIMERYKQSLGKLGDDGIRDPEFPCSTFIRGTPDRTGFCMSDFHYLCRECTCLKLEECPTCYSLVYPGDECGECNP